MKEGLSIAVLLLILYIGYKFFIKDKDDDKIPETVKPTLSDDQIAVMVQTFYGLAWTQGGPLFEDEEAMSEVILRCNNNADLARFANKYGSRAPFWGASMDLFTTVKTMFSDTDIDKLNSKLTRKGITITF